MATSNTPPAKATCQVSSIPPRCITSSINAPTTLVTVMEQTNAASALTNPGVRKNWIADA
eukprot:8394025-Ditylum_brightwellii.AAC.1